MLRNYFKTLLRNMQKHKLHTAINIIGMAVAFTCTILLVLLVYFQFSFDSFHQHKAQLYQVYTHLIGPQGIEQHGAMGYPVAPTFKGENIGIAKATRFKSGGRGVRYGDKELELQTHLVDNDFFSMFSFPVAEGNKAAPLADAGNAVLTEHAAKTIFGSENAIGKTISTLIDGEWKTLAVSAVVTDFPANSSLKFDVLARSELSADYATGKDKWDSWHHAVFVQLSPNTTRQRVEAQLRYLVTKFNPADTAFLKSKGYQRDAAGDLASMRLLPLREVHFNPALNGGNAVTKPFLYVLLLVAAVIIAIACFNFVNLNIGLSFTRTREMGIRKCLGAGKRQVWLQIWGESFFTVFISLLLGAAATLIITGYIAKTSRLSMNSTLLYQPTVLLILVALLFAVSFAASGYPSFIMGKLKTVEILKGKISLKKPGVFRNALIVVQFVIACVLICATLIIYRQFQHLRSAPLGYTTSSLISIPIRNQGTGKNIVAQMRTRLLSQASIVSVTGTTVNLGIGQDGGSSKSTTGFDFEGRPVTTNWLAADYDILKTLDIKPIDGRDFTTSRIADSTNAVIVTESMAKQLSDKNAIGLQFYTDSAGPKWNIIGVIPDFHLYSMHQKKEPLTISMSSNQLSYILIRVATQNARATMDQVKNAYAQVEPGIEFKGSYVDENIERWYKSEQVLSQMFSIAALVAIVLSCMGLFGIAFIVIKQRVKEIGVRKVLGATVGHVAVLVTKEFVKPVLIAIVIAVPIAWWAMSKWLEGFAYRTSMQWTIFLAGAVIAVFIAVATVSAHAIKAAIANPVKSLRTE